MGFHWSCHHRCRCHCVPLCRDRETQKDNEIKSREERRKNKRKVKRTNKLVVPFCWAFWFAITLQSAAGIKWRTHNSTAHTHTHTYTQWARGWCFCCCRKTARTTLIENNFSDIFFCSNKSQSVREKEWKKRRQYLMANNSVATAITETWKLFETPVTKGECAMWALALALVRTIYPVLHSSDAFDYACTQFDLEGCNEERKTREKQESKNMGGEKNITKAVQHL